MENRTINQAKSNQDNKKPQLGWKANFLLILAIISIIIAFFIVPFIFSILSATKGFTFDNSGEIGDTIGGFSNPFIALSGVIVTGLAFYMQYKANLQQRELFESEQKATKEQFQKQIGFQQFESQFYEMLKLHRENVTEMKIIGYDFEEEQGTLKKFEKITEGRKVFIVMQTEFECILQLYKELNNNTLDKSGFEKCYKLFFGGIDEYEKKYPNEKELVKILKKASKRHQSPTGQSITTNKVRKAFFSSENLNSVKLNFNYKPFSGHSQRLGHYFRHLYLTVKSIVNSDAIDSYEEKMRYLNILRAQLSNHEQIILFYNWLGGYGNAWENGSQTFFTEYCMIRNLLLDHLFDDKLISEAVNNLRTKEAPLRKGRMMFELDENFY